MLRKSIETYRNKIYLAVMWIRDMQKGGEGCLHRSTIELGERGIPATVIPSRYTIYIHCQNPEHLIAALFNISLRAISLWRVVVTSHKIPLNLPRTYEKIYCIVASEIANSFKQIQILILL